MILIAFTCGTNSWFLLTVRYYRQIPCFKFASQAFSRSSADLSRQMPTHEGMVSASLRLVHALIQAPPTFHNESRISFKPGFCPLPLTPHWAHCRLPRHSCSSADISRQMPTHEGMVSASLHLVHALIQAPPTFHMNRVSASSPATIASDGP